MGHAKCQTICIDSNNAERAFSFGHDFDKDLAMMIIIAMVRKPIMTEIISRDCRSCETGAVRTAILEVFIVPIMIMVQGTAFYSSGCLPL